MEPGEGFLIEQSGILLLKFQNELLFYGFFPVQFFQKIGTCGELFEHRDGNSSIVPENRRYEFFSRFNTYSGRVFINIG